LGGEALVEALVDALLTRCWRLRVSSQTGRVVWPGCAVQPVSR